MAIIHTVLGTFWIANHIFRTWSSSPLTNFRYKSRRQRCGQQGQANYKLFISPNSDAADNSRSPIYDLFRLFHTIYTTSKEIDLIIELTFLDHINVDPFIDFTVRSCYYCMDLYSRTSALGGNPLNCDNKRMERNLFISLLGAETE